MYAVYIMYRREVPKKSSVRRAAVCELQQKAYPICVDFLIISLYIYICMSAYLYNVTYTYVYVYICS